MKIHESWPDNCTGASTLQAHPYYHFGNNFKRFETLLKLIQTQGQESLLCTNRENIHNYFTSPKFLKKQPHVNTYTSWGVLLYFSDYKTHPLPIWEENGGASYSANVAYIYTGEILCFLYY